MALIALSPGQYGNLIDEIADLLDQDVATVHKKVALDLLSGVVKKTPVDTGRARASWKVGLGTLDPSVAPEGSGPPADAVIGAGEAKIENMDRRRSSSPPPVWITNSLPYIGALENGHSNQAPQGMVAVTAAEVKSDLASLLR